MRYAYKVFSEIYCWSNNKYFDDVHFAQLLAYLNYKIEESVDVGFCFVKSKEQIFKDIVLILKFLVNEKQDFYISYWNGKDEFLFYSTDDFSTFITSNNIDIFNETTAMFELSIVPRKEHLNMPQKLPKYIHDIFEPYLFCEIETKVSNDSNGI